MNDAKFKLHKWNSNCPEIEDSRHSKERRAIVRQATATSLTKRIQAFGAQMGQSNRYTVGRVPEN